MSSFTQKLLHCLISVSVWLFWGLVGLELTKTDVNHENFVQVCGTLSLLLGASLTDLRIVENWRHRTRLTVLLDSINTKYQVSSSAATRDRILESNKLFLLISWATIGGMVSVYVISFLFACYAVVTGEQYFTMALPVERAPYSAVWWCGVVINFCVTGYCGVFFTLMEAMFMDLCLQLAFLFAVEYDQLLNLPPTDVTCTQKLVAIVAELEELKR